MNTIRRLFQGTIFTANVVIIILFILSAYSDRVSPNTFVFMSYLGIAFPLLCLITAAFTVYWIISTEWRYFLLNMCCFLLCWGAIKNYCPYNPSSSETEISKGNTIKVLTYNVMAFGYKNHTKESPNRILEYIANSDADIVCIQEYMESKSPKYLNREKITKCLSMYPYYSIIPLKENKYQLTGLAVFSKYPISKSRKIAYETQFNGSSYHEITIKGKKLTLINNHLESFKLTNEDRSKYSTFIKSMGSDNFEKVKGSIQQKLGPAFKIRAKQAEKVAEEIKKAANGRLLVCGDFNDTPISYTHRTIQKGLKDAFAESGKGIGITYNQNFFWFRIDNIFYSPKMQSYNCTVDKIKDSDHYPLWCKLKLNQIPTGHSSSIEL